MIKCAIPLLFSQYMFVHVPVLKNEITLTLSKNNNNIYISFGRWSHGKNLKKIYCSFNLLGGGGEYIRYTHVHEGVNENRNKIS